MSGDVAERPNAPVLKTGDTKVSVSSNPTPSAKFLNHCSSMVWCTLKKFLKYTARIFKEDYEYAYRN